MAKRTKAELEREIADLRAQLADMEAAALMKAADQEKREPAEGIAEARGSGERGLEVVEEGGAEGGAAGAPFPSIPHKKKRAFLHAYAKSGTVKAAAEAVGLSRRMHYHWMKADPAYAAAFAEAQEQAADTIEAELVRRAVEGVEEPVHYRGQRVDMVRKYSDVLLIFLLKGLRPEKYRDNYNPAVFKAGGNINVHLNVPRPGQEPSASEKKRPKVQIEPPVDAECRELPG